MTLCVQHHCAETSNLSLATKDEGNTLETVNHHLSLHSLRGVSNMSEHFVQLLACHDVSLVDVYISDCLRHQQTVKR